MNKWWQWNSRYWQKKHSLFEYFVMWHADKHGLSPRKSHAYEKGQQFIEIGAARDYVHSKIKSDFAHLSDAINANVQLEKDRLSGKVSSLQNKAEELRNKLDENNVNGVTGKLHKEAETATANRQVYGSLFFPERQLQDYLDKDHEQFVKGLGAIMTNRGSDTTILEQGAEKNVVNAYIDKGSRQFRQLRDTLRELVYSKRFPLSRATYRATYAICLLFVFCEMFISRKVLLGKANAFIALTPWSTVNNIIYEVIILSYAAGISVFLAALYNMVLNSRGNQKKAGIPVLFTLITIFMSYFFSQSHLPDNSDRHFHPTGVMFGVLSAGFALANAWYYRQAGYQKDLYKKNFPGRSLKYCRRWIARWNWWFGRQLRRNNRKLHRLEAALATFAGVDKQMVKSYLSNLETSYTAEFWHGFNSRLNKIIEDNREIQIQILKQTKIKLHHEEDQHIHNSHSNGMPKSFVSA